jgi:uncharacterized protein DUF1844
MASEDDSSKSFKVQDRRRFSAEGELKPEFSGADPEAAAAAEPAAGRARGGETRPEAEPHHHAAPATSPQQAAAAAGYAAARTAGDSDASEAAAQIGEINFGAFLMSLSTEALVHLGEMADPGGGEPHRDLGMAQQLIDILGMLREKTRGNLDHDEQALLDAILFDLRMKYVEIARRNG